MYRLLITDDEALEREGLELIIQRAMPDAFHIIHAENGRKAIELAEEHRPHIVMMDVNMPGIQGLAALREIKLILPDSKLVLVTAYDYFAYAQEALTLGVKQYIVKPAGREQVIATLQQLADELDREKTARSEQLDLRDKVSKLLTVAENELAFLLMVDPVLDMDAVQLAEWLNFPLNDSCALVAAFPEDDTARDKKKIYDHVRSFAKTQLPSAIVSSLMDRHMAIFAPKASLTPPQLWLEEMKRFGEQLCLMAQRQLGTAAAVGVGSVRRGAAGLRKSYFEAVFASTYENQYGSVCSFVDLKPGEDGALTDPEGNALYEGAAHRSYVLAALQRIRQEREQQTLTVLDKAKHYIQAKFTEDLSLEEVADFVHLNPYYFSKVFKGQFGVTFIDYLTNLRIEKAKELIGLEHLSLKEVCFEVGYKDPNYFSRVFKKVTGLTPTEYRAQPK